MDKKHKNWWCPQCECEVAPENVTFTELHDERSGGCGDPVLPEKPMDNTDKLKEIRYNNRVVKHLDKLLEWKDINEGQYCVFHTDLIETIDKTLEYGKQLGGEEVKKKLDILERRINDFNRWAHTIDKLNIKELPLVHIAELLYKIRELMVIFKPNQLKEQK